VLGLTRELMVGRMSTVTVAAITSTVHGIATELEVGPANGLDQTCAISCDQITSILTDRLREQRGWVPEARSLPSTTRPKPASTSSDHSRRAHRLASAIRWNPV